MATNTSFFEQLDQIKRIVAELTDRRQAVSDLEPLLSDPDVRCAFYNLLQSADWIAPLQEAGHFATPPGPAPILGGSVRFPPWTPSRYLARMAPHAPGEVAEIFSKIETDNASVIRDILDAALAMPVDAAVPLVPAICRAAENGTLWIGFKDASDLFERLAESGELDAAMKLAEAMFAPTFEKHQDSPSRRDKYWYKEGLKKAVPVLARAEAKEFLPKLCDWLKASVEAKEHVDQKSGSDYSYMWRPAIEEHEQNKDYYFAGIMVGFVREGFEEAIQNGSLSLEEALQTVEGYPYLIFRRIRLHLIGEFADQNPELARQTILNRELFDDYEYKHEYAMLVGRRLNLLSAQQQDEWFGWIEAGPKDGNYKENEIEYWKFQKLHWVRTHLEGKRKAFYERMLAKHGEPELADLNSRTGDIRYGHDSPMTVEDLGGMTFEQAVDAVSSWRPEGSRFGEPSIKGLASTFGQYVATNLAVFSAKALVLVNKPAIFVRGFISQMSESVAAGQEIDLAAVLKLCHWVVKRPIAERSTPEQEDRGPVDKDWQWTRDDISQLVESVCKATKTDNVLRYPLKDIWKPMWQLISVLCRDRAESYVVHDISQDDPRVCDYLHLGINSPRGKAVEAALEYARWVDKHIKESDGKQEIIPSDFDAMPDVLEMLEWQIAAENRSFEALSVIGSRIGVIYRIDKKWLEENADRLFQLEVIEKTPPAAQGWAAWNAFLVWVGPHIEFYQVFKSQFAYAVEQAAEVELTERTGEQPMHHLGEHLMVLYGRDQLGLDDDEGLLRRFLETAIPDVRRHAIGFVGRSLEGNEKVPADVTKRFMAMWDLYWDGLGPKDADEKSDAWLFGTWFSCGQFPKQWALDRLEEFVAVVPTPEPDHAIAEKLAEIAHVDIVKSVRILDRIVRGDREGWRIYEWRESAKAIIEQAMKKPGKAREQAEGLIDYLGRRGFTDFGKLRGK